MLVDPPSATKREKRGFRKEGEERPKAKKDPKKKSQSTVTIFFYGFRTM